MTQQTWNPSLYDNQHAFVWQYGESLLDLLNPQPGERILDLGCGTGHLTAALASRGAIAWGIDADVNMIQQARQNHPQIHFEVADARAFQVDQPVDAIFSNATLHWIQEPAAVIQCVYQALKPQGRFVAELGGKGNIAAIQTALFAALETQGYPQASTWNPWYFPSLSEYTTHLEHHGLEVVYAALFDRPTALSDGAAGLAHWLTLFANRILSELPPPAQTQVIQAVESQLQPRLYQEGTWTADYRRLRVIAYKPV